MFILEAVQDRLSNIHQDITRNEDSTTIIEYSDNATCQCFPEYLFVLAIIRHMRYTDKNSRDNVFLAANDGDKDILPIECIRSVMSDLSGLGVKIVCLKDGLGYVFDYYRKNFWIKKRDKVLK
jgi:hypothetical protein